MQEEKNKSKWNKKKVLAGVSVGLVFFVLVYFGVGFYFFRYALARGDKKVVKDNPNLPNSEVTQEDRDWPSSVAKRDEQIKSFDDLKLVGTSFFQPEPVKKWVIVVHGYSGNRSVMLRRARAFHEEGFNVLAVDCRGYGDSEGKYTTMGWLDRKDIVSWVTKLVTDSPESQIVLYGGSAGGAAVMMAAGEELPPNVKCVIEDCGYSSVWDEFSHQLWEKFHLPSFPVLNMANTVTKILGGFDLKEASAVEQLKKTKVPVMFIHGSEDKFVLPDMVHKVYDATPTEKELYIVPGAKHNCAFRIDQAEYMKRCLEFINKYI
ncbi:alpha/beta hydrolase [Clostridia bacterium]|nr:alpha/beta hydrolase [Clostridia bacterium]